MNPNVHRINLKSGGVKLVYLTNPSGDIDETIRRAFKMPRTPIFTDSRNIPEIACSFVLDGPHARVYSNPITPLVDTYYEALVVKKEGGLILPVYVGVCSEQKVPGIEDIIDLRIIECDFHLAGLTPIASEREKLPKYFFKNSV